MTASSKLLVQKYGGSSVGSVERIAAVVARIARDRRARRAVARGDRGIDAVTHYRVHEDQSIPPPDDKAPGEKIIFGQGGVIAHRCESCGGIGICNGCCPSIATVFRDLNEVSSDCSTTGVRW